MLNRNEEALSAFNTATTINPSYAEAWCNIGLVYDSLGEYKSAIRVYSRAIKIKPDYSKAMINLDNDIGLVGL